MNDERDLEQNRGRPDEKSQQDRQPPQAQQGQAASGQASAGESQGDTALAQDQEGLSGADHQQSADGGSVTAAGGGSEGPGAGSAGIERGEAQASEGGFVGSEGQDSSDYLQEGRDQPNQGGFAEQGRGAAEGTGPEGSGERTANEDTDIEGGSQR